MVSITRIRNMAGLSQKEFGQRLGLGSPTVSKYENGGKIPSSILKLIRYEFSDYLEEDGLTVKDPDFGPSTEEVQQYNDTIAKLWLENKELLGFKTKYLWLLKEKETLLKHNEELQRKLKEHGIKY